MSDFLSELGNDVFPGMGAVVEQESKVLCRDGEAWKREEGVVIDGTSVDSGHTGKTTQLRPGLVLCKAASGRWVPVGHADCPVVGALTAQTVGILSYYHDTRDKSGTGVHKPGKVLIAGFVFESAVIFVDNSYKATVESLLKLVDFRS